MRLARGFFAAALLAPAIASAQGDPAARAVDVAEGRPTIELVFVIDTTGSMGGLIEGAKQKVWHIANEVMKAPSKPEVRMGLVAYRDRGDAYVSQVTPLSRDLDAIYATLMGYRAEGGGDGPEDVRRALSDGVRKAGWSPRSPKVVQILFLVGDAPPHDDYADVPDTVDSASEAVRAGILVNAIQCGGMPGTDVAWKKIARAGEGQYFAIAQDGGVVAIATPFDEELSRLGAEIGGTYLAYGGMGGKGGMMAGVSPSEFRGRKEAARSADEAKVAKGAPKAAQADRSLNKAINAAAYDENDLVQAVENGKVNLFDLKEGELPDELLKLSAAEREKVVAAKVEERKKIRAQILELSKKRDAFLEGERKKRSADRPAGFDEAVGATLKDQISRKPAR